MSIGKTTKTRAFLNNTILLSWNRVEDFNIGCLVRCFRLRLTSLLITYIAETVQPVYAQPCEYLLSPFGFSSLPSRLVYGRGYIMRVCVLHRRVGCRINCDFPIGCEEKSSQDFSQFTRCQERCSFLYS